MAPLSEYRYVPSCELNKPVLIRIGSLLGFLERCVTGRRPLPRDMCVRVSVYCNNRRVGPEVQTEYRASTGDGNLPRNTELHKWGEVIELPVWYSELSRDAFLLLTLWAADRDDGEVFVAQCVEHMFSKHGALHCGQRELRLDNTVSGRPEPFLRKQGDASSIFVFPEPRTSTAGASTANAAEASRCYTTMAQALSARAVRNAKLQPSMEELRKQEKKHQDKLIDVSFLDKITFSKVAMLKEAFRKEDRHLYLVIDYLRAYSEKDHHSYVIVYYFAEEEDVNQCTFMSRISLGTSHHLGATCHDPDLGFDNLHELKHLMLTRNARAVEVDRQLVPNPRTKEELDAVVNAPSCSELTVEKRDLVWKFRYYLQKNANALTKFIRSVNWEATEERTEAESIIRKWAPISICDVLELLGPDFTQPFVRRYAVSMLRGTRESDILLYLPQLVQALRYEQPLEPKDSQFELVNYLIDVASNPSIANFLFWYLKVEIEATKLVDDGAQRIFLTAMEKMKRKTSNKVLSQIASQEKFVQQLVDLSKHVAEVSGSVDKKIEVLRKTLVDSSDLVNLNGLPLPLDPNVKVRSVVPEVANLFKSSQMPMSLAFKTMNPPGTVIDNYTLIFKRGDDLRQDQLIMQMIHIMDSLLKNERLNLFLTPYAILAASLDEGFVQYVRATPVADFGKLFPGREKKEYIQLALQKYRPSASGPYGIELEAMDRFLRSCAGYCIISYILGIGDRHLHNVLLCEDGRIFHIDFGFILGRDPKPLPPPMKISPSMVYAMGGTNSQHYKTFVEYCRTAFTILQQHAKLITNLFGLMLDAGIPDIAIEKDKAVQKVLERFHLHVAGNSDEIAQLLDTIIENSIRAIMPLISDFVHDLKVGL